MKIAVITATYPPYRGGMGNVAADHAEALASAGHDVTVLAPVRGAKSQMSKACPERSRRIKCQKLRSPLRYGHAALVPQLLWRLRSFDVIELHYPFYGGAVFVWLWKRLFGKKRRLIVVYHMDTVGSGWLGLVFRLHRALFLKRVLAAADRVVVTSLDYFRSSQAAGRVDEEKLAEIPLSVDTERFTPAERLAEDTVVFVGGLDAAHYFKGIDVLLDAFTELRTTAPGARLAIVGDGDRRSAYERKTIDLGLGDTVHFLGSVDDRGLAEAYRSATCIVLPSLDRSEAFGLVLLEAAASGLPAIASDLPGVRTVVEDGRTGFRVPSGDVHALAEALRGLLTDRALAEKMGKAARARAEERYAKDVIHGRLVKIVSES